MLSTPKIIRQVGNSFEQAQLNFRNMVFHSQVTDFERRESDSGLSLKMVLKGTENYTIDNTTHRITPGHFLLVNEHQHFVCQVQSRNVVEGICIYLDPETVRDVYTSSVSGHGQLLDQAHQQEAQTTGFLEKIYGIGENRLGRFLGEKAPLLRDAKKRDKLDMQQFFIELAEHLVVSQREVKALLSNLEMERPSTREEIYRRVSVARNFIDAHFLEDISLDDLASMSCLSKYHFLRCFKQVYRQSPYQYVLQQRLKRGSELLQATEHSLTEIAYLTGFTDRRAFNKAFKKATGISPREFRAGA